MVQLNDGVTTPVFNFLDFQTTETKINIDMEIEARNMFGIDQVCDYSNKMCDHIF